jgi:hypothetical protein
MNEIKLLRDHIVRLQTMITELGKKPSTVIRFVDDNTIPQQRQINTVYYNMSNDTVLVYNDMLREWKTIDFNGGGSVDWDDINNKPTAFPPSAHGHFADGVTITGTGTTADPFVAVGGELAKRFDYVSRNLYYRATAPAGSLENAPIWGIKKVEVLDNGSIENITEVTNYKWTERYLI